MKLGVMQPYLFPYLGYYQLVSAVDKFVFYDDVNFIKGGYINRNSILCNEKSHLFTISVPAASSNKLINELQFDKNIKKILKTIEQSYSKSIYFEKVFPLVESVMRNENRNVEVICAKSITSVFEYLDIKIDTFFSSKLDYNRDLSAADKLIAISGVFGSTHYINSPGGKSLYDKDYFISKGIPLSFIDIQNYQYPQKAKQFINHLSMIDVLMHNSKSEVISLLSKYELN